MKDDEVRRRDPRVAHRVLGEHLVGRADAGRHARAGVGDADDLQQLLHGPVLAVAAVQRDERDIGRVRGQAVEQVRSDVDRDDPVAEALKRLLDARPRLERDLALE